MVVPKRAEPRCNIFLPVAFLAAIPLLLAQKPVINPNGVVNSASFAGTAKNEALVVSRGAQPRWSA